MPGTLVLSGVKGPRTEASSVVCSIRPPSQEFQFRVMVSTTATISRTTNNGTRYFRHLGSGTAVTCAGSAGRAGAGAGVDADAIMETPPRSGIPHLNAARIVKGARKFQPTDNVWLVRVWVRMNGNLI